MIKNITDKDKKDWENFITGNDRLENKDFQNHKKKIQKTKSIDLHGYSLEEANKIIEKFLSNSYEKKIQKILVITGKGIHSETENDPYVSKNLSKLKYSIPYFLKNNQNLKNIILEIKEANIEDGGSGAFYIYLKKK